MYQNGDYLVTHYEGKPEMWNTKPPLMNWAQVVCMKLVGTNELALRLPSAIAALFTCLLMVYFSFKAFRNYTLGIIAALVLVTANGYIQEHVSRTGEYDALLTFFTTAFCLCFFLFLQQGKTVFLHLFFAALALAVLTKSIQGLIFLPAIGIFVLFQKKLLNLIRNRWLYIDLTLFLLVVAAFYLGREWYNPGYLQAVWDYEWGGRYVVAQENNGGEYWYYLKNFLWPHFTYWIWLVPVGFFIGFRSNEGSIRAFSLYSLLLLALYLLIISTAKTKLQWYDAPTYPFLGFMVAIPLYHIYLQLKNLENGTLVRSLYPYAFLIVVFFYPYFQITNKSYRPVEEWWEWDTYSISYVLQDAYRSGKPLSDYFICFENYNAHILIYTKFMQHKGSSIGLKSYKEIAAGDKIIANEPSVIAYIEQNYMHRVTREFYSAKVYQIIDKKEPSQLMQAAVRAN